VLQELTLKDWETILFKLRGVSLYNEIAISGGEPFTRPDIMEILQLVKQNGMKINVISNGQNLNTEKLRQLSNLGLETLTLSLNSLDESIHDRSRGISGGIMINALADNIYSTASQMLIDYLQSYFNKQPHTASFLTTSNLAVPKDAFQRAGCFNAAFPRAAGEDREFCARWLRQGRALVFLSNAKVLHSQHLTFRSFIRQHFNYGQGAYCYHQILKQETGQSIKAEPSLFYWDLMRYAWIQKEQRKKIIITILILLSQIANATGFIYARFAPLLNK
jgi:hypothetical protein